MLRAHWQRLVVRKRLQRLHGAHSLGSLQRRGPPRRGPCSPRDRRPGPVLLLRRLLRSSATAAAATPCSPRAS